MQADLDTIVKALPFLVPLIVLEVGLLIWALLDVVKRQKVRGDSKLVWILIIVLIEVIGPIIYLAIGRKEGVVDSDKD
jgi:hypothetical protein